MSATPTILPVSIRDYILQVGFRDREILARLREETKTIEFGGYQVSPEVGQLLELLLGLMQAKQTLDIGCFTGYSALVAAFAVGPQGRVISFDKNEEWTQVARRYWVEAGVDDRIELRLGAAVDRLHELIQEGRSGTFDFAFIDADKRNYENYYESALQLIRPGGLIALDNVLWRGLVADPATVDKKAVYFRQLNAKLQKDDRVELTVLPIGDGLTLVRKKA